jgi:hypothetical protein
MRLSTQGCNAQGNFKSGDLFVHDLRLP